MTITVKVKARSSQNKLLQNPDGTYTAFLHASPVDGEANSSLIKLVSKEFDIPKSSIRILRGMTSKNKLIAIGD